MSDTSIEKKCDFVAGANEVRTDNDGRKKDEPIVKDYQFSLWSLYQTRSILDTKLSRVLYSSL